MTPPLRVIILGSTGSIGTQTIEVVGHLNALHARGGLHRPIRVVGLAAGRNADALLTQARRLGVSDVALAEGDGPGEGPSDAGTRVRHGPGAAERLVREVACDVVVAAMVGFSGLPATLAACELGRAVALANKETLVAAGALVVPLAKRTGATLLPVDSEHSGVWQCLGGLRLGGKGEEGGEVPRAPAAPPLVCPASVTRVTLTASGGPFREWTKDRIRAATPREAMNHPTWRMGPKVTIDSASLMNKALELIEAHWLFGLDVARLAAIVHPQSIVHALVEHADGSVLAQMGAPDMRTPIHVALSWPGRVEGCSRRLDWGAMSRLEFEPVDAQRFPAPGWAMDAIARGGTAGAVLNAANEEAVRLFIERDGAMPFGRVIDLVGEAVASIGPRAMTTLAACADADVEARRFVSSRA